MTEADYTSEKTLSVIPGKEAIPQVSDFLDACVEEFDVPMKLGFKLKVVADEIFSNIVYYSGAKNAQVVFKAAPERVCLCFLDDGEPYDPLEAAQPDVTASAQDREIGGLGLFMVKNMAEEISYEYSRGTNNMTVVLSNTGKKKKLPEDFEL